ncbi:MAG: tRNA (adenosine(37)-N6)-threonylcarbamoyltransferase complex ATPase subunit type 1 TsaE [Patescibacteria group bacterium]
MKVTLEELPEYARKFVEGLPKHHRQGAYIVGLCGELGAGKTAFTKEVAKALGIESAVTSPTFPIVQVYPMPIPHPPFKKLVHVDAYRLESADTDTVGWKEYIGEPENLILVEWPERVPGGMQPGLHCLDFEVLSENERELRERIV